MALWFILGCLGCSAKLLVPTTECVGNGIMIAVTALGVIVGGWALWVEEKMEQKDAGWDQFGREGTCRPPKRKATR